MSPKPRPRFVLGADGSYRVHLARDERALLATIPDQMMAVLERIEEGDSDITSMTRRLFPPAYPTDQCAQDSFAETTRLDLLEHHREAIAIFARSAEATHLTSDELEGWLTALNDLRLVLGSILDVSEDVTELANDDPNYAQWVYYHYLSYLEGEIVEALTGGLPPALPDDEVELPNDPWGDPPGDLRWDGTELPENAEQ